MLVDNFFLQVIEEPIRRGAMIDPALARKEGLMGNMKLKNNLDCSSYGIVEFKILKAVRKVHRKLANLDFRRADFGLIKDMLGS